MLHKYKAGDMVRIVSDGYDTYFDGITENLEIKDIYEGVKEKYWIYTHDKTDYWLVREVDLVSVHAEGYDMIQFKEEALYKRVKCTTKEQATALLTWAHSRGKAWSGGNSYLSDDNWSSGGVTYNLEKGMYSAQHHYYKDEVSYEEMLLNPEATTYSIQGSVMLLRKDSTEPTKVIKITEHTKISFTDKVIFVDDYDIVFDQTLLDSLIEILNNDTSNDLSQILNKGN